MKKSNPAHTKIKVNFSVDKDTEKAFDELARSLAFNKSALIEKFMERWVKENREKNEA